MNRKAHVRVLLVLAAALLAGLFLAGSGRAADETARYPYDPACAWGRIANGKGMLVRCITQKEALALAQGSVAPVPSASASASASATPETATEVSASVVSVVADSGNLPEAKGKLAKANSRFEDCVKKNGGLSGDTGEVRVRFLVRERGLAEGVSVSSKRNVSVAAARCVADVVDRRSVGVPEVPMLAATAVIKLEKSRKADNR